MTEKEIEFIKQINVDKAEKKTTIGIVLIVISILTYIIPFMMGAFDFGLIFECASLGFLLIAKTNMSKYNEDKAKRYVMYSIVSIGWIFIYDLIECIISIQTIRYVVNIGYDFFISELLTILYLGMLFSINKDLLKAGNPIKYKENTDWFYEKYEEKEKGK